MQRDRQALPEAAWAPAYDSGGIQRDGAWVAEATGVLDLSGWPARMRVLVRAERPHPGAQLQFTDLDGNRLTALATNTGRGQLADLELRHRRGARCEDRIRTAKDNRADQLPAAYLERWAREGSLTWVNVSWTGYIR